MIIPNTAILLTNKGITEISSDIAHCPSCGEFHKVKIIRTNNEKRIDPSEEICFLCGQHLEVIEHGFTQRSEE